MKTKEFINELEEERIVAAIAEAESRTSGEIRVFVSRLPVEDPVTAAKEHFTRLGMLKTADRNGVLVFVAPQSQNFAVIGDTAIHEKCGPEFWTHLTDDMSAHFRSGDFTSGLVAGIKKAGEILALHFPRHPDDRNELSDNVERD